MAYVDCLYLVEKKTLVSGDRIKHMQVRPGKSCIPDSLKFFLDLNKSRKMKGVNYLTDEKGKKTAVVISLKNYQEEIEDFLDGLEAQSRVDEPSSDFEKTVTKILKSKSMDGQISTKNKKIR